MKFSRRDVIKGMGAAGLTPLLATGCGDDGEGGAGGTGGDVGEPLPELPEYEFDGTPGPENLFEHGVASGDPTSNAVILWTRVSPENDEPVEVWWEMALDPEFNDRTAQGTLTTDASSDYTAKVDASGLVWGREYYYRFFAQGRQSAIGRTRLAPSGDEAAQLRFGVCSCSNYGFGFFHAYRNMAARADLDAVIHLGDYFYEYENGVFPSADAQLRTLEPPTETITLDDYRTRLSLYRRDADLQELHRQHPMMVTWDDHETANNSWVGGAENHDSSEGDWDARVEAARQAFFEWIPIRDNDDGRLYRTLQYGDLADIIMIDTRIEGREEQSSAALYTEDDPSLPDDILGPEQESWLFDQLSNSNAKWKVLGNQVVLSRWQFNDTQLANEDQWTGYPGSRSRLMDLLRGDDISNVVVVTGDVHSSWAMEVTVGDGSYDPATQDGAVGVEFVCPGITSPSELGPIASAIQNASPHVRYFDEEFSGYFVLDLQADKAQADWCFVDGIGEGQGDEVAGGSYATMDGESKVTEMSGPESENPDTPPLAP
ncbi:MAG: alkaline phosphatase D family protein [Myxococcota bacterium]